MESKDKVRYGGTVSKRKEYLKVAYNQFIYQTFKNDSILDPIEYTPENEKVFGLNHHKGT